MGKHVCHPFCGCYKPSAVHWWSESIPDFMGPNTLYSHMDVLSHLILGKSADDMEALGSCFARVVLEGERTSSGRWCVCLKGEAPSAGEPRNALGGDGFSGLLIIQDDLDTAADALPITWKTTERIFTLQGRALTYCGRLSMYLRGLRPREIDRWMEPRDPETGRLQSSSLTYFLMSRTLGGASDTCQWPRQGSLIEREVFTSRLKLAQFAEAA